MERQLKAVTSELDTTKSKLDSLEEDLETTILEKQEADEKVETLQKRVDELSAEPARLDTAEIDKLLEARFTTLRQLAPAFPEDFKFDGIDEDSLYKQAFENLTGSAPREDALPGYIVGVVEGILAARADSGDDDEEGEEDPEGDDETDDRADSSAPLRLALSGAGRQDSAPASTYRAKQLDAWKRPLTANKK
jgi:predicted nuclease with TOPRIM domain